MHGLVDAAHVDHLHPDSIIALATAADGQALTRECFGDEILWVDWRRPGFQLGLDIAAIAKENPKAKGAILGGHGLTTWAETSDECEKRSIDAIEKAEKFLASKGKKDPFGAAVKEKAPLAPDARLAKAALLAPALRGIASQDNPMLGHFNDSDVVLDFISHAELGRLAALGTSCPDHFLRTKISPMVIDTPSSATVEEIIARAHELHGNYRETYANYYKSTQLLIHLRCAVLTHSSFSYLASECLATEKISRQLVLLVSSIPMQSM
jgi:rhamnose utilization protein RhaD (predicted bifunctional aldolase and dehydrogenase)